MKFLWKFPLFLEIFWFVTFLVEKRKESMLLPPFFFPLPLLFPFLPFPFLFQHSQKDV